MPAPRPASRRCATSSISSRFPSRLVPALRSALICAHATRRHVPGGCHEASEGVGVLVAMAWRRCSAAPGLCGRVPDQAHHAGPRLCARRAERRDGAHPHQEDGGDPQAAGGDREPRRRRRRHCRQRGRARRARRLHHPAGDRLVAGDQRQPLQEPRLRSREGFRADRAWSAPRPTCSTPIRDRCRRRRSPSSSPT